MDWRALNMRVIEFISSSRTQVVLPCSCRAMEFGLLSLLWFSSRSVYFNLALGFLDFLPFSPVYIVLVPLSVFFLGFGLRSLCEEVCDSKKIQGNLGVGYCSGCGVWGQCGTKNQTCNGFLRSFKKRGNGDEEEEGGDVVKLREGNVKGRKCRDRDDLGNEHRSHGVCCNACETKVKPCKGFQCGMCSRKKPCIMTARKVYEEGDEGEEGIDEEEEEDDVMKLRKELMKERKLRACTEMELEKERRAASSAADEAMAKILLLQNEKGLVEREARHYREMAEQKQAYDQEVINNLRWIIVNLQEKKRGMQKPMSDGMDD